MPDHIRDDHLAKTLKGLHLSVETLRVFGYYPQDSFMAGIIREVQSFKKMKRLN